jgi:hypothetical protein
MSLVMVTTHNSLDNLVLLKEQHSDDLIIYLTRSTVCVYLNMFYSYLIIIYNHRKHSI